jgi:hypothetical protein
MRRAGCASCWMQSVSRYDENNHLLLHMGLCRACAGVVLHRCTFSSSAHTCAKCLLLAVGRVSEGGAATQQTAGSTGGSISRWGLPGGSASHHSVHPPHACTAHALEEQSTPTSNLRNCCCLQAMPAPCCRTETKTAARL